jgi:hypothetical protein
MAGTDCRDPESEMKQGVAGFGSASKERKAASAMIAKIPFDLVSWIARCFKP